MKGVHSLELLRCHSFYVEIDAFISNHTTGVHSVERLRCVNALTHSPIHSFTHSFTRSLTHTLTHSLTNARTAAWVGARALCYAGG